MAELRPSKRAREDDTGGVSETEEQSSRRAPVVVFAHGAGGNSSHEWMVRWKELLASATNAVEVFTFDYPYCANGKRGPPPKAEKLVDSHIAEIEKAVEKHSGHPLVLIGKSMGSRFFLPVSPLLCRASDFCTGIVLPFGAHWQIHGLKGFLSVSLPL
jgi:alpha-beta hydrolase superfamily lysophospholipase